MHPWVKGIHVSSIEGSRPFASGDNYEKAKIHSRNLKIFFFRTSGSISTKLGTKHPWGVKEIQVCSNQETFISHKVNNCFFSQLTQ